MLVLAFNNLDNTVDQSVAVVMFFDEQLNPFSFVFAEKTSIRYQLHNWGSLRSLKALQSLFRVFTHVGRLQELGRAGVNLAAATILNTITSEVATYKNSIKLRAMYWGCQS
jgi:hypothetical protein